MQKKMSEGTVTQSKSDIPKMSQKFVSDLLIFKDIIQQKIHERQQNQKSQYTNCENVKILIIHLLKNFEMQQFINHKRDKQQQRNLFNQKYRSFVNRIYGKYNDQRSNIENLMKKFSQIDQSSCEQQCNKFYNLQELKILEEINIIKEKKRRYNQLLKAINSDFENESRKDLQKLTKEDILALNQLKKSLSNEIVLAFIQQQEKQKSIKSNFKTMHSDRLTTNESSQFPDSKKSDNSNFKVQLFEDSKIQFPEDFYNILKSVPYDKEICDTEEKIDFKRKPSFLQKKVSQSKTDNNLKDITLSQKQEQNMNEQMMRYTQSIDKAQKVLVNSKQLDQKIQFHLDHELDYFNLSKFHQDDQMFNQQLEQERKSKVVKKFQRVNNTFKATKLFKQQIQYKEDEQKFSRCKSQGFILNHSNSKNNQTEKDRWCQIDQLCKSENKKSDRILRKFNKFQKRNNLQYHKLVGQYNKTFF